MEIFGITKSYMTKHEITLLCKDDAIIGFFCFVPFEGGTELDFFFLSPDYIGKGLGKHLWRECLKYCKDLGIDEFTLWSDPHAEKFYEKMGCKTISMRQSPILPGRYLPVMKFIS